MSENIIVAYHQAREAFATDGLRGIFRERIFCKRVATPTVMNLLTIDTSRDIPIEPAFQFFEIKLDEILVGKWNFAVPSRHYKAPRNLKRGLRCFALAGGSLIVGDVWCAATANDREIVNHNDLDMLEISYKERNTYAFDMLIAPRLRGKNLAIPLHSFLQSTLKKEGCKNVYGFYWNDNLPALWMHRMLKFVEFSKRWVSRFFIYQECWVG